MKNLKEDYAIPTTNFVGDDEGLTIEQIQGFVKEKPEVLSDLITDDLIVKTLETKKDLASSIFDRKVSDAVKTFENNFKDKKLPELVEERYKELHPDESEESKQIRELTAKLEQAELEKHREKMSKIALTALTESGIEGISILEPYVIGSTEEETISTVKNITSLIETIAKAEAKKGMKTIGRDDAGDDGGDGGDSDTLKSLNEQYQKAVEAGKTMDAIKLLSKIHKYEQEHKE